jgi:ribosomal protein S18 acetylase RimI-like enzyme
MKPHIRTASSADIPACTELLGVLFDQERDFIADSGKQAEGISLVLDNPEIGRIFVSEIGGAVNGMVMLLFTVSTFMGKKVAILEDMIVSPEWRDKGVGSRLIDAAIEYARDAGFGRITLLTDHDNETAQRFYASRGFTKSDMVVFRKIFG